VNAIFLRRNHVQPLSLRDHLYAARMVWPGAACDNDTTPGRLEETGALCKTRLKIR